MRKLATIAFAVAMSVVLPGTMAAQDHTGGGGGAEGAGGYPPEVLEQYAECQERTDLKAIEDLLWYHRFVQRIDARQYGLPKDDFDDRSLLTIEERLRYREERKKIQEQDPKTVPQATSGPVQYPHYLRQAYDHWYEETGQRPDCSKILQDAWQGPGTPPQPDTLDSSWASDLDLTTADSSDRGEVNVAIDHANENRIMASSCPSGGSGNPDSSSNFISATSDWGQTWSYTAVGNNSGSTWECDPVSYYQTATGDVYHSKIGCDTGSCGSTFVMMRRSADNGNTWSDCGRPGSDTSEDRQWHVIDNNPSSSCYGNIYITWHNSNQEKVARSQDNCSTWNSLTNLTGTYQAITPDINVAADGHVYVVWQNQGDSTFKIAGSDDCGATWNAPAAKTLTARNGDWSNHLISQCQRGVASQPYVDVDRAPSSPFYGRVYVMLAMFNSSCSTEAGWSCSNWDSNWNSTCNYDLFLMYSDDQGATFTSPVNITSGDGNLVDNFEGYMRVDPVDGSIWVSYHRSTLNPTSAADRQKTRYVVKRSKDGGQTWEEMVVSTVDGDERSAGASTFERGDYNGLDVYNGVAWPLWIDRRGTGAEENIIVRKVCSEPAHWSERGASPSPPPTNVSSNGDGTVQITWDAPDVYWGDGDEDNSQRKYQLWVDGALAQDNISWTATSISSYDPGDCNSHDYFIRAINQCGISKDYATTTFSATGCCTGNPTSVDVTPDGPLTLCTGTSQTLTANLTGGTAPFSYQWYRDGAAISGATSSTYTVNETGTHSYNCEVTGSGCTGGISDSSDTQITWTNTPSFNGLDSVTNPENATCQLDLAWTAGSSPCGSVSYNIYRSTTSGFTPSASNRIASGVTGTSYSDTDSLVSGTTYYYIVRAVDDSSGTEESNTVEKSGVPTGPATIGTWSDDVESYSTIADAVTAGYDHNAAQGSDDWRVDTGANHTTGGSKSFASDDVASTTDKWLIAPVKHLDANAELTFYHQYDFEAGSGTTGYDGGVIEISTDGGVNWSDLGPDITTGGYTHTISTSYGSPLGGRDAWSGTQSSFTQVVVDLSGYANADVLIRWRMGCDSSVGQGTWYIDDIQITNVVTYTSCTTGGGCTNPGQPTIDSITDDDACAQSGVTITYTAGSGASSHDLYVDGSLAVSGFTSGSSYDPGDTSSHSYVIRAVDGSCYTDSTAQSFTDEDNTPATPGAPTVTDKDACALTGVEISWGSVTGATAYDLLVDGTSTVANVTSPYTYSPGDSNSHTYQVRARNATCTGSWSASTSGADNTATPPATPGAPTVTDKSACALTGLTISWGAVTGAANYDLQEDGTTIATGITGTSYDRNPGDSATHTYAVRANNSCGQSSGWSSTGSGADADHSFTFAGIRTATDRDSCDDTGVVLTWDLPPAWNDGGTGTRSFEVWRDGAAITTGLSATSTSAVDTTGTNGTSYSYSIHAVNGYSCATDGGASLSAADNVGAPPTFSGLSSVTAMSGSRCGLRLEWSAATPGCGSSIVYNVYRSTTSGFTPGSANLLASCVPNLYYEDTSVTGGTTYYYVVRAEDNSAGHGGLCNSGYEDSNTVERSGVASGGSTTWTEDFESGSTGWTAAGSTGLWHEVNNTSCVSPSATSGTHAWYYGQDSSCNYDTGSTTTGTLTSPTIANVTSSSELSFEYWREVESYSSGSYDITKVEVSYDGGTNWTQVWFMDSNDASSSGWTPSGAIALSPPSSPSDMLIRFTFDSVDSSFNTYIGWLIDDVTVTNIAGTACTSTPDPVQAFTARATSGQAKLEWVNPSGGAYGSTRICRDTAGYPDPASCTPIATQTGTAGAYDSFTDTGLTNGTTYYYTAFVDDGSGVFSAVRHVSARPFDTAASQVKWAYSSAATALAPTGVRPGAIGTGGTWAVSNDRMLHGMNPTDAGGDWPRNGSFSWAPAGMNGPAQARPPVVPTTAVSGASQVIFLGSEDGHAYAVNAETGATLWQSPALGSVLLASPAGMFTDFGGAYSRLFIGSRDATADNVMYMLNPADGSIVTQFDNGGGANGIGIISSSATVDYATNRIYFASRERSGGSSDTLWCLSFDGSSFTKVWSKPYGDIDGAPILYGGRIYVGNNSGVVYAVDPANGNEIWHYATTDGAVKGFIMPEFTASTPRNLYFSTTNDVWALTDNGSSASQAWRQTGVAGPSAPLVPIGDTRVYVGSTDGNLYQLDATSGAIQTSVQLGDGTATIGSPALDVVNTMAYVGSESGAVYGVTLPLQ